MKEGSAILALSKHPCNFQHKKLKNLNGCLPESEHIQWIRWEKECSATGRESLTYKSHDWPYGGKLVIHYRKSKYILVCVFGILKISIKISKDAWFNYTIAHAKITLKRLGTIGTIAETKKATLEPEIFATKMILG